MLTIALVAASLAIVSVASPTPLEQRSIRIPLTRRNDTQGLLEPVQLQNMLYETMGRFEGTIEAYRQNTGSDHPLAAVLGNNTLSKRAPGDEALNRQNSALGPLWRGPVSFGVATPQTLQVQIDTASSDLFVPTTACTAPGCTGHTLLNTVTAGATDLAAPFSFSTGFNNNNGVVSGEKYSSAVGIATYTATGQTFGGASVFPAAYSLANFPADGVLGLAYPSLSKLNARPLVQTLVAQAAIANPVFGLKLATTGSELEVGTTDTALYNAPFTFVSVTTPGFWQVKMDAVSVAGNAVRGLTNLQVIFDSGSSFIYMSGRLADMIYDKIPGSSRIATTGYYQYPCTSTPGVSLTFGGRAFPITSALFNAGFANTAHTQCVGAIAGGFTSDSYMIIGDAFLQGYYTSYDFTNNRVGIATLV